MDKLSMERPDRGKKKFDSSKLARHTEKCHKMFDEIANGRTMYIKIDDIFPEYEAENETASGIQYVEMSVLTDEIIEYDREIFGNENKTELLHTYRPYFISFVFPLEKKNSRLIELLGDNWNIGRVINSDEISSDEGIVLNGTMVSSASPVNHIEKRVLIFTNMAMKKAVLKEINSLYAPSIFTCKSNLQIEKELNRVWNAECPKTIDIYNVGHGNADYIKGLKSRILYDIGYDYRTIPSLRNPKYCKATKAIRRLKPHCVILSHWDLDHIIGCAYAEQDIFSVKWIAPHLLSKRDSKATINSVRLANYLYYLDNLYLVDRDQINQLVATIDGANQIKIKLWLGSGAPDQNNITLKNKQGLLLEIIDEDNIYPHILLAGDTPYASMPDILSSRIDFMHVPHHGSCMKYDKLSALPVKGNCAIISTNRIKRSGAYNYNLLHHDILASKFDDVICTVDDETNLSVQIRYGKNRWKFRT